MKFLLWARGGYRVTIGGDKAIIGQLIGDIYSAAAGERKFDYEFMGAKVYGRELIVEALDLEAMPVARARARPRWAAISTVAASVSTSAVRIAKCAALIDGRVVFFRGSGVGPVFRERPTVSLRGHRRSRCGARRPICLASMPYRRKLGGRVCEQREFAWPRSFAESRRRISDRRIRRIFFVPCRKGLGRGCAFRGGERRRSDLRSAGSG